MSRIKFTNFDQIINAIEKIETNNYNLIGSWDTNQHLIHIAQAINFSMVGYPIENHLLMQHTIGKAAFHFFKWNGYMTHNTNKLTPGVFENSNNGIDGLQLLKQNIIEFNDWHDDMKAHQFYGKLSKKHHELAHSMHFANHFESFQFK